MPTVNIPGVGTVNFPDAMSPDEIRSAIETNILPQQSAPSGASMAPTSFNAAKMVSDMPWYQQLGEGALEQAKDMWTGVKQAAVENAPAAIRGVGNIVMPQLSFLTDAAAAVTKGALSSTASDLRKQVDASQDVMNPNAAHSMAVRNTPWGEVGAFGAQALPATLAAVAAPELFAAPAGAAIIGGIQGATAPVGTGESRPIASSAALAYGGQKVGNLATASLFGSQPDVTDAARKQLLEWATANDMPLTRYQMSGNKFTGLMERILQATPGSSGFYDNVFQAQKQTVTNKVNQITMNGLSGEGMDQIGNAMKTTGQGVGDQQLAGDISQLPGQFTNFKGALYPKEALDTAAAYGGQQVPNPALNGFSDSARQQAISKGVPETVGTPGLFTAGQQIPFSGNNSYIAIRSDISKQLYNAPTQSEQQAWGGLLDAFDNGAFRAMDAAGIDPQQLINLRGAYSVDKLLARAKTTLPDGTVSYDPGKIAQLVKAKGAQSPSYFQNLPGDTGTELQNIANAGRLMPPVSSSHTSELGLAGKVATGEMMADVMREGAGAVAKPLAALYAVPKLINFAMQGTRQGIPGANQFPQFGRTLGNMATGAAVPFGQTVAPQIPGYLASLLGI